MTQTPKTPKIKCKLCDGGAVDYLGDHLAEVHEMTAREYTQRFPNAQVGSEALMALFKKRNSSRPSRRHPPVPDQITVCIMGLDFPVRTQVPPEACLTLPWEFQFPRDNKSELYEDYKLSLIAVKRKRSIYVYGEPGTSKDSLFHALSAKTRMPAKKFSIKQGADIQSWFYSRAIHSDGTGWDEGDMLRALRDGYEVKDAEGNVIERIPYLILISDFDRADRAQAEYLRLILDTIEGMVEGPGGTLFPIVPGTVIAATANTAGGGDPRGRMTSANLIDGSIMDRWDVVYKFHWMSWKDEGPICQEKFPDLMARSPGILPLMGKITATLRQQIQDEVIYGEFSHRAVCQILATAEDLITESAAKGTYQPAALLTKAARCWLDRLPDPETRLAAVAAITPLLKGGFRSDGRRTSKASSTRAAL